MTVLALPVSKRASGVEYAIRDVVVVADQLRKAGKKILSLNIGDPVKYDFETPPHIRKALEKAIEGGSNYYSPSEGLPDLREAIAQKERTVNRAQIDSAEVVVTTGISEGIMFLMGAVLDPGDEVLVPGPCYPPYITYAKFFDAKPVTYRTVEDRGWAPDLSDLESKITSRTRLIVVINPNNPCGAVYSRNELERIVEVAASHKLPIAADEIYDRILYDGSHCSLASIAKDVPLIGLNGFSKAYLMTGWRLGYVFIQDPEGELTEIWDGIQRLARVRLCAATPAQIAGIEALRGPQDHIREMVTKLRKRRDFVSKRANAISGITAARPAGAFYAFPRVQAVGERWASDKEFVTELLTETGVLVVHGSGFDEKYGQGHFRVVFLPDESILGEAFDKIEDFMKRKS
jgi:tyrosine/nicotianamine family aminotransferase